MFSQLWSTGGVNARIQGEIIAFEKRVIRTLGFLGETYVNAAKLKTKGQGGYDNITGNLRASIGWMILKDGKEVSLSVDEKSEDTSKLINDVKAQVPNGFVLVVFAGMEYAFYLEAGIGKDRKVYDVITGSLPSQSKFRSEFKDLMN